MRSAVRWVVVVGSIVMSAWLAEAQPLPTLEPNTFFWETWDFQEPTGAAVFVMDGNRQGDLLAESGRPFVFQHGTQALPLACADGGWFAASSLNRWGWIVGSCFLEGVQQAVVLADWGIRWVCLCRFSEMLGALGPVKSHLLLHDPMSKWGGGVRGSAVSMAACS